MAFDFFTNSLGLKVKGERRAMFVCWATEKVTQPFGGSPPKSCGTGKIVIGSVGRGEQDIAWKGDATKGDLSKVTLLLLTPPSAARGRTRLCLKTGGSGSGGAVSANCPEMARGCARLQPRSASRLGGSGSGGPGTG